MAVAGHGLHVGAEFREHIGRDEVVHDDAAIGVERRQDRVDPVGEGRFLQVDTHGVLALLTQRTPYFEVMIHTPFQSAGGFSASRRHRSM